MLAHGLLPPSLRNDWERNTVFRFSPHGVALLLFAATLISIVYLGHGAYVVGGLSIIAAFAYARAYYRRRPVDNSARPPAATPPPPTSLSHAKEVNVDRRRSTYRSRLAARPHQIRDFFERIGRDEADPNTVGALLFAAVALSVLFLPRLSVPTAAIGALWAGFAYKRRYDERKARSENEDRDNPPPPSSQ